ncbi:MAG: hypothetical protein JSU07_04585 [Bacteroidetes bacterium]|nr:hypothetical protein [Bacteroidota bacterium]
MRIFIFYILIIDCFIINAQSDSTKTSTYYSTSGNFEGPSIIHKNQMKATIALKSDFKGINDALISCYYSPFKNVEAGIAYNYFNNLIVGSLKCDVFSLLHYKSNSFCLSAYGNIAYTANHTSADNLYGGVIKNFNTNELHRLNYFSQLLFGIKFGQKFFIRLMPGFYYRNFIKEAYNPDNNTQNTNALFCFSGALVYKINQHFTLSADCNFNVSNYYINNTQYNNAFSFAASYFKSKSNYTLSVSNNSSLMPNNFIPQFNNGVYLVFLYSRFIQF